MRHGKKFNHLGRTSAHRKALLSNMASSLILHKRIATTTAKAKELRKYVEPLITKAKSDSTHSRRIVFSYLQNKDSVKELFDLVAEKVTDRPGGYTRIIKTPNRLGDNADMCLIELVDYNETYSRSADKGADKAKVRRSRRKKSSVDSAAETKAAGGSVKESAAPKAAATPKAEAAPKTEQVKDEETKSDKSQGDEVNASEKE
ncbi:MAG: 50S ribosomal protein L17 [Cytophagaceae bacterium]